jgi:hypothetical protein
MTEIPPPLIPDNTDEPFADTTYTEGELSDMTYDGLRGIAAEHPSDNVHGRMGADELREKLEGMERV